MHLNPVLLFLFFNVSSGCYWTSKLKKHFHTELKHSAEQARMKKRPSVSLYQCKTTSGCRPCAQSNHLPARMWRFIVVFPPVGRLVGGWESCSKHLFCVFTLYAAALLCLMAGGDHYAPVSENRVERPKLGISGEDWVRVQNKLMTSLHHHHPV